MRKRELIALPLGVGVYVAYRVVQKLTKFGRPPTKAPEVPKVPEVPEVPAEEVEKVLVKSYRTVVSHLRRQVVGQDRAIEQLETALKVCQSGIGDPARPIAVLLFAGPTGVGKTEMARALAEAIHGNSDHLARVDCNQLSERHSVSSLHGSPPGYVGFMENASVLKKEVVQGKPGRPGIVLFDEIEKAHRNVHQALLNIFDRGVMMRNTGKGEVNFTNSIIIMTSNVGSRQLVETAGGTGIGFGVSVESREQLPGKERKAIVYQELRKAFAPEFLNRIDYVVVFKWLDKDALGKILKKFLDELQGRLDDFPYFLSVSASAKELLVDEGYDLRYGARPLRRVVRKYLELPIAEMVIDGIPDCSVLRVTKVPPNGIRIEPKEPPTLKPKKPAGN